jgi:hypothetical protein
MRGAVIRSVYPQALGSGIMQVPEVELTLTTQRPGGLHAGPSMVSHAAPASTSALHVPVCGSAAGPVAV